MSDLAYSSSASYRGGLGILKIEDGSLVFIKRSGIVSQRDYVVQTIPVRAIRSMEIQGRGWSLLGMRTATLVITVDSSKMSGIPRHEFGVDAPEQWIGVIRSEMTREASHPVGSPQPTYVKEIVREIVKYPCPYCNTLIEVTSGRCPNCGAPQRK